MTAGSLQKTPAKDQASLEKGLQAPRLEELFDDDITVLGFPTVLCKLGQIKRKKERFNK